VNGVAAGAIFVSLVGIAIAAATIAARYARIPYTVGLVIAGLAIGVSAHPSAVQFTPQLVLFVFLPALLFAGAWEMDLALLGRYWVSIALLASVGVAFGIAVSYALLSTAAGIDARVALMFGTLVAATDPVAVLALFRQLRVDRGLATIVEGESLFNDGVAVVAFRVLVVSAAGGAGTVVFHPVQAVEMFAWLILGGSLVGGAIGFGAAFALRSMKNAVLDIVVTAAVAYGSYIVAEAVHLSGIVAVIAAGLTCSTLRSAAGSTQRATHALDRFWELAALLANSVLFVLVGLAIDLRSIAGVGPAALGGVLAVLVARALMVYGLTPFSAAAGRPLPLAWRHIIALGGLRGALSMALVLSLPEDFQNRAPLIAMVYAVVLFTLIVQGLSLGPAVGFLSLGRREPPA
jgi:CPA1 family monovalent cation:H+ antiporter